jgi:hypothetical protein
MLSGILPHVAGSTSEEDQQMEPVQAQERRRSAASVAAVLAMHVVFGVVWFVIWFMSAFFSSFAGAAADVFVLAAVSWLAVVGVVTWRWWSGSRWYGLFPVGWLVAFLALELQSGARRDCWPLC